MDNENNLKLLEKTVIKETAEEFSIKVEDLVWKEDISYFEAILQITEDSAYEEEKISKLLTPELREKLHVELEKVHLVKKKNRLNFD